MHRSGIDQHPLPDLGLEARKVIVRRLRGEGAQIFSRRVRFQPRVDAAAWIDVQHHPALGLADFALGDQVGHVIPRMHLHRQHFAHVEEFQQERKAVEATSVIAENRRLGFGHHLGDGYSLQWPFGDPAGMVVPVAEDPGLADRPVGEASCSSSRPGVVPPRAGTGRSARNSGDKVGVASWVFPHCSVAKARQLADWMQAGGRKSYVARQEAAQVLRLAAATRRLGAQPLIHRP